jgi:hypothetical protein
MTVMENQITQIFIPSKVGMKTPEYITEQQFKQQGHTELVDLSSILTAEEKQFVSSSGSKLGMIFLESDTSKVVVPMRTITDEGSREMRIPRGFSAHTATVNGQRGLVGFPAVTGGSY